MISNFTADTAWYLIKLFFQTNWMFLAAIKLKEMYKAGTVNNYWKLVGVSTIPAFLWLDFMFNMIWGTIIYREWPKYFPWEERELLFTERCKRHYRAVAYSTMTTIHSEKTLKRYRTALRWQDRLNVVDPGHVD